MVRTPLFRRNHARNLAGLLFAALLALSAGAPVQAAPGAAPRSAQGQAHAAGVQATGTFVERAGRLEVVIADDFDSGTTETFFLLHDEADDQTVELKLSTPPENLRTGQRIVVRGFDGDDGLEVTEPIALLEDPSALERAAAVVGGRKVVVLMVDLQDQLASDNYTLGGIADVMYDGVTGSWSGTRSVDALYREASNDQFWFESDADGDSQHDVFGPFQISASTGSCFAYFNWSAEADTLAEAAGHDLSIYDRRVYVFPPRSELGCSWLGLATVGCGGGICNAWIAAGNTPMTYAHELGHNEEMGHAGTDPDNNGVPNSSTGDTSGVMSSSTQWHVFNAPHVDQMGWLDAYPGQTVTIDSLATVDIYPLNLDPTLAAGPQVVKIDKPDTGESYLLSYRQRIGYDDSQSILYTRGVNIHRHPGGQVNTHHISTLSDGGQLTDATNDITITQLGRGPADSFVTVQAAVNCGADGDGDGVGDICDNCVADANPDQRDTNADGFGNLCDADYDNDGIVTGMDFMTLGSLFELTDQDPDLDADGDGSIGGTDYQVWSAQFEGPPGPSGLACAGTPPCP